MHCNFVCFHHTERGSKSPGVQWSHQKLSSYVIRRLVTSPTPQTITDIFCSSELGTAQPRLTGKGVTWTRRSQLGKWKFCKDTLPGLVGSQLNTASTNHSPWNFTKHDTYIIHNTYKLTFIQRPYYNRVIDNDWHFLFLYYPGYKPLWDLLRVSKCQWLGSILILGFQKLYLIVNKFNFGGI